MGDPVVRDHPLDRLAVANVPLAEADGGKLVLVQQEAQAMGRVAYVESDYRSSFPDQLVNSPCAEASG